MSSVAADDVVTESATECGVAASKAIGVPVGCVTDSAATTT